MKYCPKCRLVYPDSREKCSCGRILKHYEALRGDTPVRVVRVFITDSIKNSEIPAETHIFFTHTFVYFKVSS